MCAVAERFELEYFVANPTLNHIDSCRKDELGQIAIHFGITFTKHPLKREHKALVIDKLVEQGVIVGPEQTESAAIVVGIPAPAEEDQSRETQTASRVEVEAGGWMKTPFTLPRYDPSPQYWLWRRGLIEGPPCPSPVGNPGKGS